MKQNMIDVHRVLTAFVIDTALWTGASVLLTDISETNDTRS